jgi:arylsulfatase A-like enzyme
MKPLTVLAVALAAWFSICFDAFGSTRPNIIFILVDDMGYGDLSCHGNPVLKTPNLDRLHDESIRFTDYHVSPMCTPTRGQLMTGVDALRNGAMNVSSGRTSLRKEFRTMAEIFAKKGYRTALFGKWHLGDNYPYRPQDRGFQESIWFPSSHISSAPDYWNNDYFDDVYWHNGVRTPFKGYCTDVFFEKAKDWMQAQASQKKPFLCYLPLNAAHAPLFVPDKYREPYRGQKQSIASFFGMIANIDENMAKLETFLRTNGLRENTIVIFMTDNGTASGETIFNAGMRGKKISLYEGGHRVPFFIRWPEGQFRASTDLPQLAESQDILPTLLELCDVPKPRSAHFDGISLAKLLRGKTDNLPDRMLVAQFSRMDRPEPAKGDATVLWNRWRLVSNKELYDISKDPSQEQNVISRFPGIARKMRNHYETWWAGVKPRVNEFSRIQVGSERENPTVLTPCDWRDVFLDQQAQIRRTQKNGVWTLFIERAGHYTISLRRWPSEADLPITAAASDYTAKDGIYRAGDAYPIRMARLKIGNFDESRPVMADSKEISFDISLQRGNADLQTWFQDSDHKDICGAYYVYVERKGR